MRKFVDVEVTIVDTQLDQLICDCCGKTIDVAEICGSDINDFSITFGYGSKFDLTKWDLDICDDCLEKWVSTFKHDITKKEYTLC